ncbi:MAG: site-specific DNA-methyltransferase [Pirellulaceae bacterium]|nr:site-specific DNA-methyltransferase [Pirellulaceae bacterium]
MPKITVGNTFLQRQSSRTLFGSLSPIGRQHELEDCNDSAQPRLFYSHPSGTLWVGDCIEWLKSLKTGSVDLIFADPPYNIGKADWDEFDSHDDYIDWSLRWIEEASRVLKPHGSLYVCGFSEIIADLRRPAAKFFASCKWLVWFYKNKANLTKDWGRSHESILHYRKSRKSTFNVDDVRIPYGKHTLKYPVHPQAESSQYGNGKPGRDDWRPHPQGAKPKDVFEVPVTSNGMREKTPHPTQKPEELLRKLIVASSNEGDLVIDPFSGSGTTLVCAEQLKRQWMGCDMNAEYCAWAVMRLEQTPSRPIAAWMELDQKTAMRRESIR